MCIFTGKVRLAPKEGAAQREERPEHQGAELIHNIKGLDSGSNSPHIKGDLIPAHTAATLEPLQLQPAADGSYSDFTASPIDSGYGSDDAPGEPADTVQWSAQVEREPDEDLLAKQFHDPSPHMVTGFVNPMYSNQQAKGGPAFEANPVFEM